MSADAMKTYKANVRVAKSGGIGTMIVMAHVAAQNPLAAKLLLEAQYGRGNLIGVLVQASVISQL
jgi:hypothetical protein